MGLIHGGITIFDTGCDGLTATALRGTEDFSRLKEVGQQMLYGQVEEGYSSRDANFEGYAGALVEHGFFGLRGDGAMLQARSALAKTVVAELARNSFDGSITRLDLQVTVQHPTDDIERAYHYQQDLRPKAIAKRGLNRLRIDLDERGKKGSQLVLGSKRSDRYIIGYDKSREQDNKVAPRLWRWEAKYHRERAQNLWRPLCNAAHPRWVSLACVIGELMNHGVDEDWMRGAEPHEHPSCYSATSHAKTQRWLKNHVRPSVEREIEAGYERDCYESLGLEMPARLQLPLPLVQHSLPRPDKDKIQRQLDAMRRSDEVREAQWRREQGL